MQKRIAHKEALFYEELLKKEINEDRESPGKKPLKEKDHNDDNGTPPGGGGLKKLTDDNLKDVKQSNAAPRIPKADGSVKPANKKSSVF